MVDPGEYLEKGFGFHGHRCPSMPMGLRVGAAAMNMLGVKRSIDTELMALLELGEDHCATCFADGIQVITGCTFGKGNIKKLHYGKWGVTLIDRPSKRAVRVVPRAEAMVSNRQTSFFKKYIIKGIPPSKIPLPVVQPLIDWVMSVPDEAILSVAAAVDYHLEEPVHSYRSFICEICAEMVVEDYARMKGYQKVCLSCLRKEAEII